MKIALFHNPNAGDRSLDGSQVLFRDVATATQVDSKVFVTMVTPTVVRNQPGALDLLAIGDGE